jgi:serine/threonine protein kinase
MQTVERSDRHQYTFIQKLGSGSFGSVWKAHDENKNLVAIKIFKLHPNTQKYVEYELQALKQLSSPNLDICRKYAVCVLDYYTIGSEIRIVMDYIDGIDLQNYMQKFTLLQRQARTDILKELVIGLNELHKKNIAHQDIKEENIIWDVQAQKPKYVDWGLACLKKWCKIQPDNCRAPCGSSGTAYTMPPGYKFNENKPGNFAQTQAHDIWSLGVVLLDWYTFQAEDTINKYYAFAHGNQLSSKAPSVMSSAELQKIIANIPNTTAARVLSLLLVKKSADRLKNWPTIVTIVSNIPDEDIPQVTGFTVQKCEPPLDPLTDTSNIIVLQKPNTVDRYLCFTVEDILQSDYKPALNSFWNKYLSTPTILTGTDAQRVKNYWIAWGRQAQDIFYKKYQQILQNDNLEQAAEEYLKLLNLENIYNAIQEDDLRTIPWSSFWKSLNNPEALRDYVRPFFWAVTFSGLPENPQKQLLWEFIFDNYTPTVVLAAVFQNFSNTKNLSTFAQKIYNEYYLVYEQNPIEFSKIFLAKYLVVLWSFQNMPPNQLKQIQNEYSSYIRSFLAGLSKEEKKFLLEKVLIGGLIYPFPIEWSQQKALRTVELSNKILAWI